MTQPLFNPDLPEDNSPIVAAELRSQLTGLSGLIDDAVNASAYLPSSVDLRP